MVQRGSRRTDAAFTCSAIEAAARAAGTCITPSAPDVVESPARWRGRAAGRARARARRGARARWGRGRAVSAEGDVEGASLRRVDGAFEIEDRFGGAEEIRKRSFGASA